MTTPLAAQHLEGERIDFLRNLAERALEAPDLKAAVRACLPLVAGRAAADCAFAFGAAPQGMRCDVEADYLGPDAGDAGDFVDLVRRSAVSGDDAVVGATVIDQRLVAAADIGVLEARPSAMIDRARDYGFRSLLSVPFESVGAKFGLALLFRRPPRDMDKLAETMHGLSIELRNLLARKRAEAPDAPLRTAMFHASDAVVIAEAGARPGTPPRIVYVNRAFGALAACPADAALGRTLPRLFGPRTEADTVARIETALARREPARIEVSNQRKDGDTSWAEMALTPVADDEGRCTRWIAILRDITRRKRDEEALNEHVRRQTAILDALPAHVALLDSEGRIVSLSRRWPDFAASGGIDAATAPGRRYADLVGDAAGAGQAGTIAEGIAAVLAGRQPQFSIDHPCESQGRRRWYRLMVAPIAGDRAEGAVATHLDITATKLAEEALRREKEFSEFLVRSSTEGILVFDRQFRITLWNPGIEAITGMSADRVLGRRALEVLPYLAGTPSERAMRGTFEDREASLYDQRYAVPATGREGFYEAYFSPLYSRGREVVGGIGFLRETTERRRIEDALRQSQKMEAVGQLTGGIAHDFNNMLTVIAGNLELLESKLAKEPRLLRLVSAAALAASRAEKLTQQLLTFSRRQQLRPQPIDFNQIVIGMDDLLHRTVGEHIDIRTQLAPELWPALADPNQIETSLLNLILNARDAMIAGGHITIETSNAEIGPGHDDLAPGAYATLGISDTGQGMSEDVLAHVFEPFFTTKAVGKGTGLGLSQVYGFIKQSGGHIRIESRLGYGTTVRLYLPRAAGAADGASMTPMRDQQYRGSETVLVVEDDHGVRDFAVSVLRELGYRVLEAPSGDAAMDVLAAHADIDLLFTDVVMPGTLNGADLAKAALERRRDLRVLFTSGYTTRLVEKEWPTGSIELLRKPYRSIDLAARIRAVLDQAGTAAE